MSSQILTTTLHFKPGFLNLTPCKCRHRLQYFDNVKKSNRSINHAFPVSALLISLLCVLPSYSFAQTSMLWESLCSGDAIALIRHALAPGTGDPPGFKVDNCNTQRNLSAAGADQSTRIGLRFRDNGIKRAQVFSSQWCRCLDTARLLELGQVQALPIINSFFRQYEHRKTQTQALKDWTAAEDHDEPVVLVTHQVNITALTDVYPKSGVVCLFADQLMTTLR